MPQTVRKKSLCLFFSSASKMPHFKIPRSIRPSANDIQRAASIYGKSGGQQPPPPPPNSGGSGQPPPAQPSNGYSMIAPINACQTTIGVNDSFPRLAFDPSNEPVFVCKFGISPPYPVMACYLNGSSKTCVDTGLIANF
jgi:hypothetical protein